MTPEQLQHLRDKIASSRQPVERGERYVFCRGWNEALDYIERCFKEELGKPLSLRADIIHLLTSHRLPLSDEKLLQQSIGDVLEAAALDFEREVHLGPGDIVDFMVFPDGPPSGVAIEVKIKGNRRDIFRQLERYCGYDAVTAIVLATNVPMALPVEISGKPTGIAAIGRGWL